MFSRKILTFKAIRRKEGIALKEYDITSNTTEDIINENKRLLGQFFTITNPFSTNIFYKWMELIPDNANQIILEPFAGSNNIVAMIQSLGFQNSWSCFDIEPPEINKTEEFPIVKQDTLTNFPKGFSVGITNPPYLAKNSATRRKLNYPDTEYDDLYKLCIDTMLKNLDYVAAIIPESFITSNLFHERIFAIVSLTCKMFEDTECPVCLALFVPESQKIKLNLKDNFKIYNQERFLGTYKQLKSFDFQEVDTKIHWEFNSKTGSIGVNCIDSPREASFQSAYPNHIFYNFLAGLILIHLIFSIGLFRSGRQQEYFLRLKFSFRLLCILARQKQKMNLLRFFKLHYLRHGTAYLNLCRQFLLSHEIHCQCLGVSLFRVTNN